jgi:adenosylcobalamin-dependent ribonucleoside-triphosphate reductase
MILEKPFIEKYKQVPVQWGGVLGLVTFLTSYSRIKENGQKEDWVDCCARVVNGVYEIQKWHCQMHDRPFDHEKARVDAHKMFEMMFDFRFLPPGRGLWAMGTEAMWTHGAGVLNNCGFFSTKDMSTKPFKLLMHFSMLGVGCGFDTEGAGTRYIQRPSKGEIEVRIEDSREGWVDSTDLLLDTYLNGGPTPMFDYRGIRKKGEILKTFGGTASGPEPLIRLHHMIRLLCESYIGRVIDTEWLADVGNMIGVCVEMGGIRRSAEIILGMFGDRSFYNLKSNLDLVRSHRYMSNNSVKCIPGCDYTEIYQAMRRNGDPGIAWMHNAQRYGRMNGIMDPADFPAMGVNPCVEQTLWDKELCNLVETFPGRHQNLHQYMRTLKCAYRYAKTVTLMKTGFKEVDDVIERNRRIGTSQTGIIKAFNRHGRHNMLDWCDKGYDFLNGLDADFSCWFGVNRSIKRTSIKPSGTVPLLCGETGALNYPISEYYHRTIRLAENNPMLPRLEAAGYRIEENEYGKSDDTKTMVVYFPVKHEGFTRGQADVSMWEQLENAAAYQEYWADNQVSTTIAFSEKEADDIPRALEMYENRLKAVSFFPHITDFHGQLVYKPISEYKYHASMQDIKPVNFSNLGPVATAPSGCDSAGCAV